MLEEYSVDDLGVIHQVNPQPFVYDQNYIQKYYSYGEKEEQLSSLRLNYLSLFTKINSILDVGYGTGSFLKACTTRIPNCYGYDITGIPVPNNVTFVDNIFNKKYDVITFFDVLEHFKDINVIKDLKCNYVMVSLPWCYNFNNKEWFANWKHRKPNEHLHHFNEESLSNFFASFGYRCISFSNVEDNIRVDKNYEKNILTAIFQKNK